MSRPAAIDAVYTWVDGSRPDYIEMLRQHAAAPRDLNPERFRDSFDCLRHSLRSLELHAPWIRNVYLFTCRPQVPAWLRRDHPRLRLVHHDEVITEPGVLPTFNSNVIEMFLHRLPGLSEHFLYLNDDFILGRPISPNLFYAADGRIRICGTWLGEHHRSRVYERQWASFGLLEHGPVLVDRVIWAAMQRAVAPEIAALFRHRFRQMDELRSDRLYRWYALAHARDRTVAEPFWRYLRYAVFHKVKSQLGRERRALARIAQRRPAFLCLNDDQGSEPNPHVVAEVRGLLAHWFGRPSSFECPDR